MNGRRALTITSVRRDPDGGFWRARVTIDGHTLDVDRRYGSWQGLRRRAPRSREWVRCEVLADVAAALQARVRPLERAERLAARPADAVGADRGA